MKSFLINKLFIFMVVIMFSSCKEQHNLPIKKVVYGDLVQQVHIAGNITAHRKTIISAPYVGYISKIYVTVGQRVAAGDPIVSIVQSLRNKHEEVYPLLAPFSGTVAQILKTEGEYVDPQLQLSFGSGITGGSLIRIDDLSKILVELFVPELEIDKLKIGQQVMIRCLSVLGHIYHGQITNIALASRAQGEFDRSKVEFVVQATISDPDEHLKSGMSAMVEITTGIHKHVLLLPHEFVRQNKNQHLVTMANGKTHEIKVGIFNNEYIEIVSGLKEGDKVQQTNFLQLAHEKKL